MLLNWVICRTIKSYGATKTLYNSRHIWCRGVWFELRTSTLATSKENIFSLNTEGFTVFAILVQAIFPPTSVRIIVQTEIVSIGRDVLCLSAHIYLNIEIASDCAKLSESALYSSRNLSSARL